MCKDMQCHMFQICEEKQLEKNNRRFSLSSVPQMGHQKAAVVQKQGAKTSTQLRVNLRVRLVGGTERDDPTSSHV